MANKANMGRTVGSLIRYGPLVYGAVQKYGPQVWEQVQTQREPAERFMQAKVAKGNHRKKAMAHAQTVRRGSVLQVFHRNEAHWIVFSGEQPIAVHPATQASYEQLLEHADLDQRVRPQDAHLTVRVPRRLVRRGRAGRTPEGPPEGTGGPWAGGQATQPGMAGAPGVEVSSAPSVEGAEGVEGAQDAAKTRYGDRPIEGRITHGGPR